MITLVLYIESVKEIRNLNPHDIRSCEGEELHVQDRTRFYRNDNKIMIKCTN
jgi:hypothetical protein